MVSLDAHSSSTLDPRTALAYLRHAPFISVNVSRGPGVALVPRLTPGYLLCSLREQQECCLTDQCASAAESASATAFTMKTMPSFFQ